MSWPPTPTLTPPPIVGCACVCVWACACGSAFVAESSIPPGVALATPNIGSNVEGVGQAGNPANAIDELLFPGTDASADIPSPLPADAGPDTRWSGPVNVPCRARLTTAGPGTAAVLLGAGWEERAACDCCACASSSARSCSDLRDSPALGEAPSGGGANAAMGRFRTRMSFLMRILIPWSAREHERGVDSGGQGHVE